MNMAAHPGKTRALAPPARTPRRRGTGRKPPSLPAPDIVGDAMPADTAPAAAPAAGAPEVSDLVFEPSVRRWETPDRYYEAHITSDMFDSLVLVCINGGIGTRRGQMRTTAVGQEQIRAAMSELCMRRLSRAYLLVSYRRTS